MSTPGARSQLCPFCYEPVIRAKLPNGDWGIFDPAVALYHVDKVAQTAKQVNPIGVIAEHMSVCKTKLDAHLADKLKLALAEIEALNKKLAGQTYLEVHTPRRLCGNCGHFYETDHPDYGSADRPCIVPDCGCAGRE